MATVRRVYTVYDSARYVVSHSIAESASKEGVYAFVFFAGVSVWRSFEIIEQGIRNRSKRLVLEQRGGNGCERRWQLVQLVRVVNETVFGCWRCF